MTSRRATLYAETLWASPYVFSSWVALREKGLAIDVVEVSLLDLAHLEPAYRDPSLTAKVPALVHDGFWLAESSAIAEYLDDVFAPPEFPRLLPEAPRERARARQLMAWFRSDLGALRDERPTVTMFFQPTTRPLSPTASGDVAKLVRVAEQVVRPSGGPLFGGWSLADSELAFMLHRLILNQDVLPERLRAWAAVEWSRPSVREFVTHARPASLPAAYWRLPWNVGSAAAPADRS